MITAIISLLVGAIEILLGLRIFFRLVGANPASGFVDLVYDLTAPLVQPFAGIFGQTATIAGEGAVVRSVFDWTALIAFIFYGVIGAILIGLMRRPRHHAV
jgi:hypothetical protein